MNQVSRPWAGGSENEPCPVTADQVRPRVQVSLGVDEKAASPALASMARSPVRAPTLPLKTTWDGVRPCITASLSAIPPSSLAWLLKFPPEWR